MSFSTPVLLIIFNRPSDSLRVIKKLQKIKPKVLFIAADGPRTNFSEDIQSCIDCRKIVLDNINWECDVKTNFQDNNLGCGLHVSGAINWFFRNVYEGIILEDDCIPSKDFFVFSELLLSKYRNNEDVYVIGGSNFQKKRVTKESYYFSAYGDIWGWASWRRAWEKYNFTLTSFDDNKMRSQIEGYFSNPIEINYWLNIYFKMKHDPYDTWDFQWHLSQWYHGGINIIPNVNLISNIGFNAQGTHTLQRIKGISNRQTSRLNKIIHPSQIKINKEADSFTFNNRYNIKLKKKLTLLELWYLFKHTVKRFINQ